MKKPNFFIVGAPRCGTTSLSEYLKGHPNIFFCTPKEPHFFSHDLNKNFVMNMDDYLKLFENASPEHLRIGEGSTRYLFSKEAIKNIYDFAPDAKLIVMLRNPVDLVYSFHSVLLRDLEEDIEDFKKAWQMQDERKKGKAIPATCYMPQVLQYREVGKLGKQLQRLFEVFPREQVKVILFDDFVKNTRKVYEEVIEFLDLPNDKRENFPKINESRKYRSRSLAEFTTYPPERLVQMFGWFKKAFGCSDLGHRMMNFLRSINSRPFKRPPLDESFRQELIREFLDDIELLESLLNKDLSSWKS